jgi:hypothetical protein
MAPCDRPLEKDSSLLQNQLAAPPATDRAATLPARTSSVPDSPVPGSSVTERSTSSGLWGLKLVVGAALTVALMLRPPAPSFQFDAAGYWAAARGLLGDWSVFGGDVFAIRGVLTSVLYAPAAAATAVFGDSGSGFAVLAENAVLIAVIGVVLIPALVRLWRPVTARVVVVSAVGTGVLLAGFAPFPLTDLWAAALLLTTVVALGRGGAPWLLVAGLSAGMAFNLRPAALVPVAAVGVAVLVARRLRGLWFGLGVAAALVPQVLLNVWRGSTAAPWPEMTGWLTQLQSSYASYVIRYDTVSGMPIGSGAISRRFYCSPAMAQVVDGDGPSSPGELAGTLLAHLPQSVPFAAEKVGAALHWPLATPYSSTVPGVNGLFALLVTAVAVVGAAALIRHTVRLGRGVSLAHVTALIAWACSAATLVTATTETRFALPLVLFGLAGCAHVAAGGLRPSGTAARIWLVGTVVAVVAVFGFGHIGMAHPTEGNGTVAECAGA